MPRAGSLAPEGQRAAMAAGTANVTLKDGRKLSLFSEKTSATPIAKVGSDVVTLRDLGEAIASAHGAHDPSSRGGAKDFSPLVDRLVDVRLVFLEAQAMGIVELPEFKASVEQFTENALRESLKRKVAQRAKVDPKDVERAYQDSVREWKVRAVMFEKESDARELEAAVKGGASFDELANQALKDKKAKGATEPESFPESKMLPEILAVVKKLPTGAVSEATKVPGGFAVLRVDAVGYPEDPQARVKAAAEAREAAQNRVVQRYVVSLIEKNVKVDKKLLKAVDYDGPGVNLEALGKDRRVLARLAGEKPFTVGDLTKMLEKKNFHGAQRAAESKRLNRQKEPALHSFLAGRLLLSEARRRGIHKTEELKYLVREHAYSVAFGALVDRVILPEVKVTDADVQVYYDRHPSEFVYPSLYRVDGLAFATARDADAAAKKLRSGTDLEWLRANAENQLDLSKQALRLDGFPVSATALPPGLAGALSGARSGDYRSYTEGSTHYVIRVLNVTPPQRQPLDQVRDEIAKRVRSEKMSAALADWTRKLRQHYPVEILIASIG
jgi:peptidyl-prolyl cis-trans isomerase C